MRGFLTVDLVRIVTGYSPVYHREYDGATYEAKSLFVQGTLDDGTKIKFYSPTIMIREKFPNSKFRHIDENSWIGINKESKIVSLINVGDRIEIDYGIKNENNIGGYTYLNRVKIVKDE